MVLVLDLQGSSDGCLEEGAGSSRTKAYASMITQSEQKKLCVWNFYCDHTGEE